MEGGANGFAGLLPCEGFGGRGGDLGGFEVEEGEGWGALVFCGETDGAAREIGVVDDGGEHGVERVAGEGSVEERGVEEVGDAAVFVESEPSAGDAVEGGGERVGVVEERLLTVAEGGDAETAVGVGHEGAAAGHGDGFRVAVWERHGERHFAGQGVVETAPCVEPVDVEVGGEGFARRVHLVAAGGAETGDGEVSALAFRGEEESGEGVVVEGGEGGLEGGAAFGEGGVERGEEGFVAFDGGVCGVVSGETAEEGGEVAEADVEGFEGGDGGGECGIRGWGGGEVGGEGVFEGQVVRGTEGGEP